MPRLFFVIGSCLCLWTCFSFAYGFEYELESSKTIGQQSFEAECEGEDEVVNAYTWFHEPSSQADLGICYAHTSLVIYKALYYEAHGVEAALSPILLSIYEKVLTKYLPFSRKTLAQRIEGGIVASTLRQIKAVPFCRSEDVEGFLAGISSSPQTALNMLFVFLKAYAHGDDRMEYGSRRSFREAVIGLSKHLQLPVEVLMEEEEMLKRMHLLVEYVHEYGYARNILSGRPLIKRTLAQFFVERCRIGRWSGGRLDGQPHVDVKLSLQAKTYVYRASHKEAFIKRIVGHFKDGAAPPIHLSIDPGRLHPDASHGRHSMIVYGLRCRDRKLAFLLRNSWGGLSMRQQRARGSISDPKVDDEVMYGDFWLPRGAFLRSLQSGLDRVTIVGSRERHRLSRFGL